MGQPTLFGTPLVVGAKLKYPKHGIKVRSKPEFDVLFAWTLCKRLAMADRTLKSVQLVLTVILGASAETIYVIFSRKQL